MFQLFVLLIWLSICPFAATNFANHEARLHKELFHHYNPAVRPYHFNETGHPINVTIELAISQIVKLNQVDEVIKCLYWFRIQWKDEITSWDPEEHGNVTTIKVKPGKQIWRPDISIYNSVSISKFEDQYLATMEYTGKVSYLYPIVLTTTCSIDFKHFPYDKQVCGVHMGSWVYDGTEIDIEAPETGNMKDVIENSEWHLEKFYSVRKLKKFSCCKNLFPTISYYMLLERRPLHYLLNLVFPCSLLMVITIFGFFLPPTVGERIGLNITNLLALTVFLLLVAENMPPQGSVVPTIGKWFGAVIGLMGLSVCANIMVMCVYHKADVAEHPPPACFTFLRRQLNALASKIKKQCKRIDSAVDSNQDVENEKEIAKSKEIYRNSQISTIKEEDEECDHPYPHHHLHRGSADSAAATCAQFRPMKMQFRRPSCAMASPVINITNLQTIAANVGLTNQTETGSEEEAVAIDNMRKEWQLMAVWIDRLLALTMLTSFVAITLALLYDH